MDAPPVQYVRTSDGYDIGYRITDGAGPPLLFLPPPLFDMDLVWQMFPQWMEGFARRFRIIQFDFRGEGYSTRNLSPDTTMEDFYRDMEAVVERVGLKPFYVWAWAGPSHLAVRHAVDHPEQVLALLLSTSAPSNSTWKPIHLHLLPSENWTLFLRTILPVGLGADETARHVRALQASITPEDWDATGRAGRASDIAAYLPRVVTPTLVMYPKESGISAEETIRFAAMIPGARFTRIDEGYLFGDADQGLAAIDAFLGDLGYRSPGSDQGGSLPSANGLSARELEVRRLLAAGQSNQQIAGELVISLSTVAKHVSSILSKTGAANRTAASVYARDHGLA